MPTYEYKCEVCGTVKDKVHSIKEDPTYTCCNTPMVKQFHTVGFVIRGGTEAMNWKEKRMRMKKNSELGVRQMEKYGEGSQRLRPNVAGVETDNWSDAAKLAKEAGINTSTYEPMIEKEKRTSKISGIDDAKWKAAKEAKA